VCSERRSWAGVAFVDAEKFSKSYFTLFGRERERISQDFHQTIETKLVIHR